MKYLLDTDHISILQRQSGPEYATLMSRIAQHTRSELAFSIISFHEQVLVVRARASCLFQQGLESPRDFRHMNGVFNGLGNDDAVTLALRFNVRNQLVRLLAPGLVQADDDHITLLDQHVNLCARPGRAGERCADGCFEKAEEAGIWWQERNRVRVLIVGSGRHRPRALARGS